MILTHLASIPLQLDRFQRQRMYHLKMVQGSETTASKMCVECGCENVGSTTGIADATINDVSNDGESGLSST